MCVGWMDGWMERYDVTWRKKKSLSVSSSMGDDADEKDGSEGKLNLDDDDDDGEDDYCSALIN